VAAQGIDLYRAGKFENPFFDQSIDSAAYGIFGDGQFFGDELKGFPSVFQMAKDLDIGLIYVHAGGGSVPTTVKVFRDQVSYFEYYTLKIEQKSNIIK
jgi:hypothetical protein